MATVKEWIAGQTVDGRQLPRRKVNNARQRHGYKPLPAVNVRARQTDHKEKAVLSAVPPSGPGTELKRILSEFGVDERAGCGCKDMARTMDRWGPDGCEEHIEEIVAHLKEAASKQARSEQRRIAWGIIASRTWVNPLRPYHSLVQRAIEAARVAAASEVPDPKESV